MTDLRKMQRQLGNLWGSFVNDVDFDIQNHKITFDLTVCKENVKSRHLLVFKNVASFYYSVDSEEGRFYKDVWNVVELTEIYYYEEPHNYIANSYKGFKEGPKHESFANFVLTIWNAALFIEAAVVIVDQSRFEVGYPKI